MRRRTAAVALAAGGLMALGVSAPPVVAAPGKAVTGSGGRPPVVKLRGFSHNVTVSHNKVTSGVVRFKVGRTHDKPGTDVLNVVSSRHVGRALRLIPKLNGPKAAKAVRKLRKIATFYGGAATGTKWDVFLPKGAYWAFSTNSVYAGDPQKVKFKVVGDPRSTPAHPTVAWIDATSPNVWRTGGLDHARGGWIQFSNTSKELHFASFQGVKQTTTNKMVRAWFKHPDSDPTFYNNKFFVFNFLSPGVTVALTPTMRPGKYLLACYMASKVDGTPHAFMGMWQLIDIG